MQEELAKMFMQNMTFSNDVKSQEIESPQESAPMIYSITQHYHHSAHLASNDVPSEVSQTPSPTPVELGQAGIKETLIQHGVDPSKLLPTQLILFHQAAPDQQSRLLQLWSISPPEYVDFGAQDLADELGAWEKTTVEQEEEMARLRYQRKMAQQESSQVNQHMNPETTGPESADHHAVEPYIASGYELLAQRDYNQQSRAGSGVAGNHYSQAIDPAFVSKGWWEIFPGEPMEHQYGMFDQMNQFRPMMQTAGGAQGQEDEEML
ncbi:hypothetical protein MMC30_001039 [Trapelia coarctata]|nr:hypothetical protein [Trapelia coarctata]